MKRIFVLMLVLSLALPVLGLAAEATTPDAAPATKVTPLALGAQRGRRWNTTPEVPANPDVPQNNYVDENNDGICDTCGVAQGTNPDAPGFVDADGNGVCDNLGTAQQYQGGFAKGKGQRGNREMQSKGPRGYVDADGDGVCDNLGTAQRLHNRIGRKGMPGRGKMYGAGQMQPDAGQMQPGGGRMQPGGGRIQPGAGQMQPGGGRMQPGAGQMQPGGGRMQPGGGRMQPGGGRNRR